MSLLTVGLCLGIAVTTVLIVLAVVWPSKSAATRKQLEHTRFTYGEHVPDAQTSGDTAVRLRQRAETLAETVIERRGLTDVLTTSLSAAGLGMRPGAWVTMHLGVTLASGMIGMLISGGSIIATIVVAALGAALPLAVLSSKKRRRRNSFADALPDTLMTLAGAMKVGHSVGQALEDTAASARGPMGEELQRVIAETRLGTDLDQALNNAAERMDSKDLAWVAMAIQINRGVGGSLGPSLLQVGATIRERQSLRRHVRALSAEGRLSMYVLGALAPGVFLYELLLRPDYIGPFLGTFIGIFALSVAVGLNVLGFFVNKKIATVEI